MLKSYRIMKMCINNNYYTCGTTNDYNALLDYCDNCDDLDIVRVSYDIFFHSSIDTRPEFEVVFEDVKNALHIDQIELYQSKVDEHIKYFGRVGGALIDDIDCAGLYLDINDNKVKLK